MVNSTDLIRLPYSPDLTEGGIAYALRSLPHTFTRAVSSPYDKLRRTVAGAAVELAFRRFLSDQGIAYDVKSINPFTEPERYDVTLGGRRCDIKSFLISHSGQITALKQDLEPVLAAPALVPSDQNAGEGHSDSDIYLFAFVIGVIAASQEDIKKAEYRRDPLHLVHVMPEVWMRPPNWSPLGSLVLKSESAEKQVIEINGQVEGREMRSLAVELSPHQKVQIAEEFFTISHIKNRTLPEGRIGIHSTARKETHVIGPMDWGNIWIYGHEILMAGWLTRSDFNQRAKTLPEGSRVFQYDRTRTKNLYVPVQDLKPIGYLMERVRAWNP